MADSVFIQAPRVLIRYVDFESNWRAIFLRDVKTNVKVEKVYAEGKTGQSVCVGEDLVCQLEGRVDLRCLRAVEDLHMDRHAVYIAIEDDNACSESEFGSGSEISAQIGEAPGQEPSLMFIARKKTIAVPVKQRNVKTDGTVDRVYADLLKNEEQLTELWLNAVQIAKLMALDDSMIRTASVDVESSEMLLVVDEIGIAKVVAPSAIERWGKTLAWILSTVEINVKDFAV